MSTQTNRIFQVLATKDDQKVAVAGTALSALDPNQIGVFDAETNLAINAAGVGSVNTFFLAMGIDTTGDGVANDVIKSAFEHINKNAITAYNLRCYTPTQPQIWDFHTYNVECETNYGFKFLFDGIDETWTNQGTNLAFRTFIEESNCCGAGCTCPDGDCVDITRKLVDAINNDEDALVTASYVDYATDPDTPAVIADIDAWVTANPGACPSIRLTTNSTAINNFCRVNMKYHYPRNPSIQVVPLEGFTCSGTLVEVQELIVEQGSGYDVVQKEIEARGWNGEIYKSSYYTGTESGEGISPQATKAEKYVQIDLHYENTFKSFMNPTNSYGLSTIAIPCGDDVTAAELLAILDALTPGLDNKADDYTNQCTACDTANTTSEINNTAQDGIG